MATQKQLFDEATRLYDACKVVKPHLTPDDYNEHVQKVLDNWKLYKMNAFGTSINRAVKDVLDND